ncbi:hypothetical protein BU25DRAFT_483175 [Macroventuria anomochaeta]|uniref:Uncharacterized protein n=1 Tax=Macroventuria anomochaeta TaxID=301207 RepID=A0ACB6RIV1_9PLEO|nr:uncharacterized protein BU25DRAFT_483175 [Macroventuria anomochaeta]KAF2621340.1 hypothetical protein BU25DRAFT_483175 [Macroventuria anomochaeta]
MEPSIFGAGPSGTKQPIAVPEIVEPGESRNSDNLSSAVMVDAHKSGAVPQTTIEPKEEEGTRFRVCAGNLMSASPWFNRALKKNGWMESSWNPEAGGFTYLLKTGRKRPDYYECGESVDLLVNIWVADLRVKTPIPTTYFRDLVLWIWISWTFKLSDLFKQVTAVAIGQPAEPVRNLGLPIPAWITDEIDLRRYRVMESVVSGLAEQLDVYRNATYTCPIGSSYSFWCGSMLLSALTKEVDSWDLISPRLKRPCLGQTFDALCVKARSMESETRVHGGYSPHSCNVSTAVNSIVDLAVASVAGLGLREKPAWAGGAN